LIVSKEDRWPSEKSVQIQAKIVGFLIRYLLGFGMHFDCKK
jgi:hypothetical protein